MVTSEQVKNSFKNTIRKLILGVAIIALVVSASYLLNVYVIEPYKYKLSNQDTSVTEDNTGTTQISNLTTELNIQAKYSALMNINSDFVGKLYINAIDEAGFNVVQTDNNSKYLTTGFKGETTRYGTLFVDYRNKIESFDSNTIIYGHNMRDGTQLGSLSLYEDIENYKAYPIIEFNTIYSNYQWKIFAAFITNSEKSQDNGYNFPYLTTTFPSDAKFLEFIDEVKTRSYYTNSTVDIVASDKILTLSTCDTVFDGARFVLMARLVRDGESADVDTSTATENNEQRFPQAWYDAKSKTNPYRYSEQFSIN